MVHCISTVHAYSDCQHLQSQLELESTVILYNLYTQQIYQAHHAHCIVLTLTVDGLPQSSHESFALFPATLALRLLPAEPARLKLLLAAGAGATYVLPSISARILSR